MRAATWRAEELGLCGRTVGRWRGHGGGKDGRDEAGVSPAHKITDVEKATIVAHATSPEYRELSPRQIVPLLADKGVYVASESSFYRVLHEYDLMKHREPSRSRTHRRPPEHVPTAPNTVWSWDITYLRSPVRGIFFYLYLVVDIFSRKVVAYRVHDAESAELASSLLQPSERERRQPLRRSPLPHPEVPPWLPEEALRRPRCSRRLGRWLRLLVQRRAPAQRHPLRATQRPRRGPRSRHARRQAPRLHQRQGAHSAPVDRRHSQLDTHRLRPPQSGETTRM